MSFNRNELNVAGEKIVKDLDFFGLFPANNKITFPKINCFAHSFIKLSITTSTAGTITLKWMGKNNLPTLVNIDHLDDPSNAVFNQYFDATLPQNDRGKKTTNITFPTDTITLTANTYKLYTLPISGEACEIEIQSDGSNNRGVALRVALSNNFHYVQND